MMDYRKEVVNYLEELYNIHSSIFTGFENHFNYAKFVIQKYGRNFNEFLAKRNVNKDDLTKFILTTETPYGELKNRVEPMIATFNRAIGYFILKSSIYKLKNNPTDILYEKTNNEHYDKLLKYIPMLYPLTLIPNRVNNKEEVGFSVVFYAKKDKKEIIKEIINVIGSYLYDFIKTAYDNLKNRLKKEKKELKLLIDYYGLMLDELILVLTEILQEYQPLNANLPEEKKEKIKQLMEKYTNLHNYPENLSMNDYFKILDEINEEIGNNKVYKSIIASYVANLFFFNPFVKFLGFDLMNIVDNDHHLEKGIKNLENNFNLILNEKRLLIKNYKLSEDKRKLESIEIDFFIVEDPAELNLLFYKDISKDEFEKLARVFYDLSMFFSIGNIQTSLLIVDDNQNQERIIYETGFYILNKFLKLYNELEEKYIFGNNDFYLDILKDSSFEKRFTELLTLSYFLTDNAVFMYSAFFGINDRHTLEFTIDPVYFSVTTSTFNITSVPLVFYSAISGVFGINIKRNENKYYSIDTLDGNLISKAYLVIDSFDKNIQYDLTDLSLSLLQARNDPAKLKLYLYLFEALTSASINGETELTIFSELNKAKNNYATSIFDAVSTLKDTDGKVNFIVNPTAEFKALPIFDKMLLSFSGITSKTVATIDYYEDKANYKKEIKTNGKTYITQYNKPLGLVYKENGYHSNLSLYIKELTNPIFNYLGLVVGLTQFSACNPYITPLFSNIVNCRSNLFSQLLFKEIIKRTSNKILPINEAVIIGPIANYMYAEFLRREFNLNVTSYDFNDVLYNYISKIEHEMLQMRIQMLRIVERISDNLDKKYHEKIRTLFGSDYLHFEKPNLISVYTKRTLKDTNNYEKEKYNISCVISNIFPASMGFYTAGISLAGSLVYASLSEMYMFAIDQDRISDEREKELTNAYRIIEDYITGKFLIPNLMLNWITLSSIYGGNINEKYRRVFDSSKGTISSLFTGSSDVSFAEKTELEKTREAGILASYLYNQVFVEKIKDAGKRMEYRHIESARVKLISDIDEEAQKEV